MTFENTRGCTVQYWKSSLTEVEIFWRKVEIDAAVYIIYKDIDATAQKYTATPGYFSSTIMFWFDDNLSSAECKKKKIIIIEDQSQIIFEKPPSTESKFTFQEKKDAYSDRRFSPQPSLGKTSH